LYYYNYFWRRKLRNPYCSYYSAYTYRRRRYTSKSNSGGSTAGVIIGIIAIVSCCACVGTIIYKINQEEGESFGDKFTGFKNSISEKFGSGEAKETAGANKTNEWGVSAEAS
jgi:hypothetical protein